MAGLDRQAVPRDTERPIPRLPDGGGSLFEGIRRRTDAAFDFLHAIRPRHSRHRFRRSSRLARFTWLRQALTENAATLFALVQSEGVLNTTVALSGSSRVAIANNPRPSSRAASATRESLTADDAAGTLPERAQRTGRAAEQQTRSQPVVEGTDVVGRRSARQHDLAARDRRRAGDGRSRPQASAASLGGQSRGFFSFMD